MENFELKKEALESASEYIEKLLDGIDICYNYIQNGQVEELLILLGDFFDGLEWLSKALELTADIQKNPIMNTDIGGILINIEQSMKEKDYVSLGDSLLYELKPVLLNWRTQLLDNKF